MPFSKEMWAKPEIFCFWSPAYYHNYPAFQEVLPNVHHFYMTEIEKFPRLYEEDPGRCFLFITKAEELPSLLKRFREYSEALIVPILPIESNINIPPLAHPNGILFPLRPETGFHHPYFVSWLHELSQGIVTLPVNERKEGEFFSQWLSESSTRLLAEEKNIIIAEPSSRPFVAPILIDRLIESGAQFQKRWYIQGPMKLTAHTYRSPRSWLQIPANDEKTIYILYGEQKALIQASEEISAEYFVWIWAPALENYMHAWEEILPFFPVPENRRVSFTRWGAQKLFHLDWNNNVGELLKIWDILVQPAGHCHILLNSSRVQLMAKGTVPHQSPEPLQNLISQILFEVIDKSQGEKVFDTILSTFEESMLRVATKLFITLQDATKFLGISRATLVKKLNQYRIPNPWARTQKDSNRFE